MFKRFFFLTLALNALALIDIEYPVISKKRDFFFIAERLRSLGTLPSSTLREHLQISSIHEATGDENAQQMVKTLAEDLDMICIELTGGIALAEKNNDQPTADLFIAIRTSLEKHKWMLEAYVAD
jgi:starvation-inducible DNA-binding protein